MSEARAHPLDDDHDDEFSRLPLSDAPVADPRFRHAMTLLVVLSVPLWAAIIAGGFIIVRTFA